jgi:hypothetical protein
MAIAGSFHAIKPAQKVASQDNVIMKAKLAIIILGVLVLTANGANAQHRTGGHTHVRHLSRTFGQAYGYVGRETPQYQSSQGLYGSLSQGVQSYPNPDRELYVNRTAATSLLHLKKIKLFGKGSGT